MKSIKIIEGVVAEFEGKYWGFQHGDAQYTHNDFGSLENADISDPAYCVKATDKTYNNGSYNPDYEKLSKAKLVRVKKTITIETV